MAIYDDKINVFTEIEYSDLNKEHLICYQNLNGIFSKCWAPYSGFLVACGVLLSNGQVVYGTNQENAAYPSGMCAERVALFAASNFLADNVWVKAIIIAAKHANNGPVHSISPCGGCRQVILEFQNKQNRPIEVVFPKGHNVFVVASSAQVLLPYCFDQASLKT